MSMQVNKQMHGTRINGVRSNVDSGMRETIGEERSTTVFKPHRNLLAYTLVVTVVTEAPPPIVSKSLALRPFSASFGFDVTSARSSASIEGGSVRVRSSRSINRT
ncbi:hypothetical protein ALC60_07396 [Trachymyrmex zeteki]|uniref:Uncharacterized protein n=1 Tax=Mycetomoellerius zeteki TaxID=64791 RepID=A0A151WZY4_9HYME|nr:hypothetical protein ALC60_07396 [Trachymyrmex zeteki]